jgi:hypothetical protein
MNQGSIWIDCSVCKIKWLHYPSRQCLSRQRTQRVHTSPTWQPFNASLRTIAIIMARTSNSDQSQLPISHCWRTVPISSNNRSATSSKLSSETGYLPLGEEWRDHIFHWPIIYHYRSVHFILTFTFLSGSAIWHSYHTAPTILGWYFGDVIEN